MPARMEKSVFSGRNAYRHLEELSVRIGPRLTGSRGEHAAADYVERHFKSLRLAPRRQKYPCITFRSVRCSFQVRDGGKWRSLECQPVMLRRNTPAGGVEGPRHFVESGEEEYLSPDVGGKIVLVCGSSLTLNSMIEGQVTEEPIRVNFMDHNRKVFGNLPACRIRHLDGLDVVKRRLGRGRLELTTRESASHSFNVIGEKKGSDLPEEIIAVTSHYDSSMGIPGASDNAGGTALMMELARVIAQTGTRRTFRFIAFSGEETGLYGSLHYARELCRADEREKKRKAFEKKIHKTEMEKHRLCFNLDVHGAVLGLNRAVWAGEPAVGASVKLLSKETGTAVHPAQDVMASDGTCLAALQIPTIQLARYGGTSQFMHSSLDDIRNLSPDALEQLGRFAERWLRRYAADAAAFPFERSVPEDQMKKIKKFFTKGLKTTPPGEKEEKKPRKK